MFNGSKPTAHGQRNYQMIEIEWSRCKTLPRDHQKDGVRALLKNPLFGLMDEVGAGKSKQIVDTAQILFEYHLIDTVVALTPAFARGVWSNPDPALGEVAKHSWDSIPFSIREYSVLRSRLTTPVPPGHLEWVVSNYEFIRREERLGPLLAYLANKKFWLVCDESWAIKDQGTAQWKASYAIRQLANRVTLLNGTPIADNPIDLNAQMRMLDEKILGFQYLDRYGRVKWSCADSRFRGRYAILKPNVSFPLITGWQNLEELRAKVAPYVLRRKTRDCFDLPPVLDPVMIEAKLSDTTWRIYKSMRDEMVAWLNKDDASVAKQAIVKGLRLAQITSGFLGGIVKLDVGLPEDGEEDDTVFLPTVDSGLSDEMVTKEIGREKLDAMLAWLEQLSPQPDRLLIWGRFRPELERTAQAFDSMSPKPHLARRAHLLYGQQSKADRTAAIAALNPDIQPDEPVVVVANPAAGGAGLNFAGASMAISMSEDFLLRLYLQKRGRIDRPGQKNPIRYVDVVATGPKGQRTINHHVLAALRTKEDIANWTTATWRKKLLAE